MGVASAVQSWLALAWGLAGREQGQTGVEYAMVAVVVIAGVAAALLVVTPGLQGVITNTLGNLSGLISNAISAAGA